MTASAHDDRRTARLLATKLEALALATEHALDGGRSVEVQVLRTVAATRHAVALQLLSADEADAIWAEVARRHPAAGWCTVGPGLAA